MRPRNSNASKGNERNETSVGFLRSKSSFRRGSSGSSRDDEDALIAIGCELAEVNKQIDQLLSKRRELIERERLLKDAIGPMSTPTLQQTSIEQWQRSGTSLSPTCISHRSCLVHQIFRGARTFATFFGDNSKSMLFDSGNWRRSM